MLSFFKLQVILSLERQLHKLYLHSLYVTSKICYSSVSAVGTIVIDLMKMQLWKLVRHRKYLEQLYNVISIIVIDIWTICRAWSLKIRLVYMNTDLDLLNDLDILSWPWHIELTLISVLETEWEHRWFIAATSSRHPM